MASTSALRTQKTTSAQANNGQPWSDLESATEVIKTAIATGPTATLEVAAEATAAAPTYNEGDNAPLSQDLTGNLRVRVAAETTKLLGNVVARGTVADNGVSSDNPGIVGGVAQTAASYAPGYTNGDVAQLAVDKDSGGLLCHTRKLTTTDDALVATPVASSLAASVAYATSLVVKASAGRLFSVNGYNSKATAQFIQVLNSATLPADTAVPVAVITVPGVSNFSIDFGPLGIPLSTGIVLSNSSTGPTKTIGSADVWFTASYV